MTARREPPTLPGYTVTRDGNRWIAQHNQYSDIRFAWRTKKELRQARGAVLAREIEAFNQLLSRFTPGGYLKSG